MPYNVSGLEAAIVWFGQVTTTDNYADVRVAYQDQHMFVHLNIIDRRLWYNPQPSIGDLTDWDAVSLYLDIEGTAEETISLTNAYRFDAQLSWWEQRDAYQAAYRSDGSTWSFANLPFTTESTWSGHSLNTDIDDRGWSMLYRIPYSSLGLEGTPMKGTIWSMAIVLHDRDQQSGPTLSNQTWPDELILQDPSTWGIVSFGTLPPYKPPTATPAGVITIPNSTYEASIVDADVGGSSTCGALASPDYFPTWGELNYAGKGFANIQNLGHISEWPCFSKYYITFPLDALAPGKAILSAQMTLYQHGNAGEGETPGPQPSLIQVSTVDREWKEENLTWNNAPYPRENVSTLRVDPLAESPPWPGLPRQWDISSAVAKAYANGDPLRLVLYSPDWDFHSGKYFYTSDIGGSGEGRPTLTINWGEPLSLLEKWANKATAEYNDGVEYTLKLEGTGRVITLTDILPDAAEWSGDLTLQGTTVKPSYDTERHQFTWQDSPQLGEKVQIVYTVIINTSEHKALVNRAEMVDESGRSSHATATVTANPHSVFIPLLLRP